MGWHSRVAAVLDGQECPSYRNRRVLCLTATQSPPKAGGGERAACESATYSVSADAAPGKTKVRLAISISSIPES